MQLSMKIHNNKMETMRGEGNDLDIKFFREPGIILDFFFSFWMTANQEELMARREESGIPKLSKFEEEVLEVYKEESEVLERLERYTHFLLEPTYILPSEAHFKYPSIEAFLEGMEDLSPEKTKAQQSRILNALVNGDDSEEFEEPIYTEAEMITMLEKSKIASEVKWELFLFIRQGQNYLKQMADDYRKALPLFEKILPARETFLEEWNQRTEECVNKDPQAYLKQFEKYYDFSSFGDVLVTTSAIITLLISLDKKGEAILIVGPNSVVALKTEDDEEDLKKALTQLGNLTEKSKFMILQFLAGGDHFGQEIAEKLELTKPTVSHHMNYIISQHWVTVRQSGVRLYYRLDREQVLKDLDHASSLIRKALENPDAKV